MIMIDIMMKQGNGYVTLDCRSTYVVPNIGDRISLELPESKIAELLVHKIVHEMKIGGQHNVKVYTNIVNLYDKNDIDPPLSDIGI